VSNKQEWRKVGDREYLRIEARPPRDRKLSNDRCQVEFDCLPGHEDGAWEAMTELIKRIGDTTDKAAFYGALYIFLTLYRGPVRDASSE